MLQHKKQEQLITSILKKFDTDVIKTISNVENLLISILSKEGFTETTVLNFQYLYNQALEQSGYFALINDFVDNKFDELYQSIRYGFEQGGLFTKYTETDLDKIIALKEMTLTNYDALAVSAGAEGWGDEKIGSRIVVYEDIEHLNKKEIGKLKSDIKSDSTAGDSKLINVKGGGKKRSFGFNTCMTSNSYSQIPFDGEGDRRIYPSTFKMLESSGWLASKLRPDSVTCEQHRTNAINYIFKIYKYCESKNSQELQDALYYRVPKSKIRGLVEDSTSTDGNTAMNIIKRSKSKRSMIKNLSNLVVSDVDRADISDVVNEMELSDGDVKISGNTLKSLWKMLPTGKDSTKSLNYRSLLYIFGVEGDIKPVRINGLVKKGIEVRR